MRTRRPRQVGGARGPFTLVELIVVLTIVGLALALVAPRVGRLPAGLRLRAAADELRAAFRDAGTRARATGTPVRLVLDPEAGLLRLEELGAAPLAEVGADLDAAPAPAEAEGPADGDATRRYRGPRQYRLPRGVQWEEEGGGALDEAPVFLFQPDGEAAGPTLELSAGPRVLRLSVDRLTGRPLLVDAGR